MNKLSKEIIKGKKFYFDEKENNIKYEEYIFNGLPIPNNIQIKNISNNSLDVSWDINDNYFLNQKLTFKIEIKEEKEKEYKEIYEGKENKYKINNLIPNNNYEFRICCVSNGYNGTWSLIQKI